MWTCNKCGQESEDQFDSCWNCGADRESSVDDDQTRATAADEGAPFDPFHQIAEIEPVAGWDRPRSGPGRDASSSTRSSTRVSFDPAVIQKYAGMLYQRALTIVWLYTAAGVFLGLLLGASAGVFAPAAGASGAFIGVLAGAFIGWNIGSQKAFWMELQAQIALCQVEIEANTRR
jgi:hypothetical protein